MDVMNAHTCAYVSVHVKILMCNTAVIENFYYLLFSNFKYVVKGHNLNVTGVGS